MSYIKSAGRYVFLFPIGVVKEGEVKVQRVRFPYTLIILLPYVLLYVYLSFHANLLEILTIVSVAVMYLLIEDRKVRAFVVGFLIGVSGILGLEHLINAAYGVLGGFIFGSEVYIDDEWNVFLKQS